jgi:hypothetical protein
MRDYYRHFLEAFARFRHQNGPEITGRILCDHIVVFRTNFESFLFHCSRYFAAVAHSQTIRRNSPIIEASSCLLHEWAVLVAGINELGQSTLLPHLPYLEAAFTDLIRQLESVFSQFVWRQYHRDSLKSGSNYLKSEITDLWNEVFALLSNERVHTFRHRELKQLSQKIVFLSRDIHANFMGMLPSARTATPEMERIKTAMKAACADIVFLLEAAYQFRRGIQEVLDRTTELHAAICSIFDDLGIEYQIRIAPLNLYAGEEPTFSRGGESPDQRVRGFVDSVGKMLDMDSDEREDPVARLGAVKVALKDALKLENLTKVERPLPVRPPARGLSLTRRSPSPNAG